MTVVWWERSFDLTDLPLHLLAWIVIMLQPRIALHPGKLPRLSVISECEYTSSRTLLALARAGNPGLIELPMHGYGAS